MMSQSDYSPHPQHLRCLFKNFCFIGPFPLNRFFDQLDEIDPWDRHQLLSGWMYSTWEITSRNGEPTEEDAMAAEYADFKTKCRAVEALKIRDHFIVQAIVEFILIYAWENARGSYDEAIRRGDEYLLITGRHAQEKGEGHFTEDDLRRIEERMNNQAANTRLWRRRYELFCTSVVAPLLDAPLLDQPDT